MAEGSTSVKRHFWVLLPSSPHMMTVAPEAVAWPLVSSMTEVFAAQMMWKEPSESFSSFQRWVSDPFAVSKATAPRQPVDSAVSTRLAFA